MKTKRQPTPWFLSLEVPIAATARRAPVRCVSMLRKRPSVPLAYLPTHILTVPPSLRLRQRRSAARVETSRTTAAVHAGGRNLSINSEHPTIPGIPHHAIGIPKMLVAAHVHVLVIVRFDSANCV